MVAPPLLRHTHRQPGRGFTLLEITFVMVMLLAIAAVAVPSYNAWRNRAYDRVAAEVLRNVSTRAQSSAAAAETGRFDIELLTTSVENLPPDVAAAAEGVNAAVTFEVVTGASGSYGEISVGIDSDGERHGLAMVSRSGNCVTATAGLRGTVDTEVHGPLGDACRGALAGTNPSFEPPGPPDTPDLCAPSVGGCDESDRRIVLRWAPSEATDVEGYDVFRQPGACPPAGAGELLGTTDANTHTYTDTDSLTNDEPYCYWVIAVDRAGNRSNPDRETLTPTDDAAPTAPTDLVATGLALSVRLDWTAATDDFLAGYRILRSTEHPDPDAVNSDGEPGPEASTYELVATTTGPATTFLDDLSTEVGDVWTRNWWYRVEAYDTSDNVSEPSNPATAKPTYGSHAGSVSVTAVGGVRRVTVTWTPAAKTAVLDGYRVYRDGALIADTGAEVHSFTDTGLEDGTSYTYEVTSYTIENIESPPGTAAATTVKVPSGLATTPGANQITLAWTASAGAERYHVDVDGSGEPFADVTSLSALHGGLGNSESHTYRVRACADYGTVVCTGWSTPVSGITLPGAAVLTATSGQPNVIPLAWPTPANVGASSWEVQYRLPNTSNWMNVATDIPGATRTWNRTEAAGAVDGQPYVFRVRAKGPTGLWGPWSNEVTAASMAKPNKPTFTSGAGPGTIQCPRGYFSAFAPALVGLPVAYPVNHCTTTVINNGGPGSVTVSGQIIVPHQEFNFTGAGTWVANNVSAAHGTSYLDFVYAVARACNQAGCVENFVTSLSAPRPTIPALSITGCIFFHCEVRAVSFFASSMEVETFGGLAGGGMVFHCSNCYMRSAGNWSGATIEAPRKHNGLLTFHVTPRTFDEPCNLAVCVFKVVVPMGGTNLRASGSRWVDAFAPDHWCKPGTGVNSRPLEASCRYSSWIKV